MNNNTESIPRKTVGGQIAASVAQSDRVVNWSLWLLYVIGLLLSFVYDTWLIGIGVGTLSLIAYYSAKYFQPDSDLYQYVLSVVLGFFMAQYIYQMHGLFEMHFMAFVGSTMLITYRNWKLQIPLATVVVVHHSLFNYLQYLGYSEVYFSQLVYLDIQTLIIHGILATTIFGICGLWSYQFNRYSMQIEKANIVLAENRRQLLLVNEELARSNSDLMEFASVASHDLKEPVRKIQSFTKLLAEQCKGKLDETSSFYFDVVVQSAHRMKMLIEDILQYSKLSSSHPEKEKVNLSGLIATIINDLELLIREQDAEITVDSLCEVKCIPGQIRQVFHNLITNALKFKTSGKKSVIKISSEIGFGKDFNLADDRKFCKIKVSDNGIGFDMKQLDIIFALFKRLHSQDEYEGTGIGLAIVKKIIERHSGHITAESERGKGSTFLVYLPLE